MTTVELERIERELGISLPSDYKSLMTNYPFPADSFTADCLLPNRAARLLEIAGERRKLPPKSFIIGDDSADQTYFLNASLEHSPVYCFDVPSGTVSQRFADLSAYVRHCEQTDAEVRHYAQRAEKRKWWQFWIPRE